jgi:hypothetical protein
MRASSVENSRVGHKLAASTEAYSAVMRIAAKVFHYDSAHS